MRSRLDWCSHPGTEGWTHCSTKTHCSLKRKHDGDRVRPTQFELVFVERKELETVNQGTGDGNWFPARHFLQSQHSSQKSQEIGWVFVAERRSVAVGCDEGKDCPKKD